jgi:hypothetical protein
VRGLWEQASEEERKRAHLTASTILGWWLGLTTKSQTAARLEVTPLRLWQLGQMALSGMTAGLLKQPRRRGRPVAEETVLRRRVAELEKELARAQGLATILAQMPVHRDGPATGGRNAGTRKRGGGAAARGAGKDRADPGRARAPGQAEGVRGDPGAVAPHDAGLEAQGDPGTATAGAAAAGRGGAS